MTTEQRTLWADKRKVGRVPIQDAWCDRCCDTAALYVLGKWHCGSCGSTKIKQSKSAVLIPVGRTHAHVSFADFDRVKGHTWNLVGRGYAGRRANGLTIYMHRLIMDAPLGKDVDHRDGNLLNNRRSNLRVCEHSQNLANAKCRKDSPSGYKGVRFHRGKWEARIKIDYKGKHLGRFNTAEDAARAYNKAAVAQWGEHAQLNVIKDAN
jgi:ribosomal protein S27AE